MTALADIMAELDRRRGGPTRARLFGSTPRFKVRVGDSARRAIQCETVGHALPIMIDGCPVEKTDDFRGWEVVEL